LPSTAARSEYEPKYESHLQFLCTWLMKV
jgi:hypothetical protein